MAKVGTLVDRLDIAIDKLAEVSSNVSLLLAVHEQKLNAHDFTTKQTTELIEKRRIEMEDKLQTLHARISSGEKDIHTIIDVQYDEILTEIKELRIGSIDLHNALNKRISFVEKWVWTIFGSVTSILFIFELITNIAK